MKLLADGAEMPFYSCEVSESIDYYYSTYKFVVPGNPKFNKLVIDDGTNKIGLHVMNVDFNAGKFHITCCAQKAYDLLNMVTVPVAGEFDIPGLCKNLGIQCYCKYKSATIYWLLPSMKIITLIDYINKYGWHENGGGTRCYLDMHGNLHVIDMKSAHDEDPSELFGQVQSDQKSIDFQLFTPGVVHVTSYAGLETTTKDIIIQKNVGEGNLRVNDTTSYLTEMREHLVTNDYWFKRLTSRKFEVDCTNTGAAVIGKCVSISGVKPLIVTGITYSTTGNEQPLCKITLSGAIA